MGSDGVAENAKKIAEFLVAEMNKSPEEREQELARMFEKIDRVNSTMKAAGFTEVRIDVHLSGMAEEEGAAESFDCWAELTTVHIGDRPPVTLADLIRMARLAAEGK